MKTKFVSIAAAGCAALLLSSCYVEPGVWGASVSYSTPGFSSSVAWSNASYDVNGFPIYGYSYGRPVYGYTAAGAAIFSIAALTAWCYVPDWRPAPWYRGHYHYPSHCHRAPAPPKYGHGHHPNRRPSGGINAPIHRNPSAVLGKPTGHHGATHRPSHKPGINHASRPNAGRPSHSVSSRPNVGRPSHNVNSRPSVSRPSHSVSSRPSMSRPSHNVNSRPNVSRPSHSVNSRPNVSRPSHSVSPRPNVSRPSHSVSPRPSVSRPSHSVSSRPSVSRPSHSVGSRPSSASRGGARPSGGHRR